MQLTSNQYPQIPAKLKVTLRQSHLKASLSANAEMLNALLAGWENDH